MNSYSKCECGHQAIEHALDCENCWIPKCTCKLFKEAPVKGLQSTEYYNEVQREHGWLYRQMMVQLDSGIVD